MAGFRLFGQVLTSESLAAGAAEHERYAGETAGEGIIPFHPLGWNGNLSSPAVSPADAVSPGALCPSLTSPGTLCAPLTADNGNDNELQLMPAGRGLGNGDATPNPDEIRLHRHHSGNLEEQVIGQSTVNRQPSTVNTPVNSSPPPSDARPQEVPFFQDQKPKIEKTSSLDQNLKPCGRSGLVKIKLKPIQSRPAPAPASAPTEDSFRQEPLAKKPKILFVNRKLNDRKTDVTTSHLSEVDHYCPRPDVPQAGRGREGTSQRDPLLASGRIRSGNENGGQAAFFESNGKVEERGGGGASPFRAQTEVATERREDRFDLERRQPLKGGRDMSTPSPHIIFKKKDERPRLQVLGPGLGLKWKKSPTTTPTNTSPRVRESQNVHVATTSKQPPPPERLFGSAKLDTQRTLCIHGLPSLSEVTPKQFAKELQKFLDGLWADAGKPWPGSLSSPRYGTIVHRFKVNDEKLYTLVELFSTQVAVDVMCLVNQTQKNVVLGKTLVITLAQFSRKPG